MRALGYSTKIDLAFQDKEITDIGANCNVIFTRFFYSNKAVCSSIDLAFLMTFSKSFVSATFESSKILF